LELKENLCVEDEAMFFMTSSIKGLRYA